MNEPAIDSPNAGTPTSPGESTIRGKTVVPEKNPGPPARKEPLERCYRAGGCLPDQPGGATPQHFGH